MSACGVQGENHFAVTACFGCLDLSFGGFFVFRTIFLSLKESNPMWWALFVRRFMCTGDPLFLSSLR